jgi:hypothetical protein
MKITIESTDDLYSLGGVVCRVWEGTTDAGTKCFVFVSTIAVPVDQEQESFESELLEMATLCSAPPCPEPTEKPS